jgi:hypothetical protein
LEKEEKNEDEAETADWGGGIKENGGGGEFKCDIFDIL